jgi:hypothetical protein
VSKSGEAHVMEVGAPFCHLNVTVVQNNALAVAGCKQYLVRLEVEKGRRVYLFRHRYWLSESQSCSTSARLAMPAENLIYNLGPRASRSD